MSARYFASALITSLLCALSTAEAGDRECLHPILPQDQALSAPPCPAHDSTPTSQSPNNTRGETADCNNNGVPDPNDIANGTSMDCNENQIPDECEIAPAEYKLLASDAAAGDWFGQSVAVSGDTALVGAPWNDDVIYSSGSAYILRWNGLTWSEQQKLTAEDAAWYDNFGAAVAIDGDVAVIGAPHDANEEGSAYIFRWNPGMPGSWLQEQKLTAADGEAWEYFSQAVAVSGDTVVIGAHSDDDHGPHSGSAYIYHWDGSTWIQQQEIYASDAAAEAYFGYSVAISGDVVMVGAHRDGTNGLDAGAVYAFVRDGSTWSQQQKLTATDAAPYDTFGCSIALDGEVAVIGAPEDGIDSPGSAYVFAWNPGPPGSWIQQSKLSAADAAAGDYFGCTVALRGNLAVIGAPWDDDTGDSTGSASVFRRDHICPDTWIQQLKLTASDAATSDWFGYSVATNGTATAIGASWDDDAGNDAGSVYLFHQPTQEDCNNNGVPDECDIADDTSRDINSNGIPDECECLADLNCDHNIDLADLAQLLSHYGESGGMSYEDGDLDADGDVDLSDLTALLAAYGTTCA